MLVKGTPEIISDREPAFYRRLFLVEKVSIERRPVIDLSPLSSYVKISKFTLETVASILASITKRDVMSFVDLKDTCFLF